MHSPAKDDICADEEDGTNGADSSNVERTNSQSQDDINCLIENLAEIQADNISYGIEKIVGVHRDEEGVKYQVRWVAYSWIPEECLESFHHLIKDYLEKEDTLKPSILEVPEVQQNNVVDDSVCSITEDPNEEDGVAIDDSCSGTSAPDGEHYTNVTRVESEGGDRSNTIVKDERLSSENNNETFPLPTASIVTIGGNADACSDDTVACGNEDAMHCPNCQQRFFLKSNLEVHVLFCKGTHTVVPSSPGNIEVTVGTEEVDSSLTSSQNRCQLNVVSEDLTFEYVPLDSESTDCTTCRQRLPEGAMVGDSLTDLAQLVAHSRKGTTEDEIEIYECDECDRQFLYKYPLKKSTAWLKKMGVEVVPVLSSRKRKIRHDKPFSCSICNRGFEKETDKAEHEEKHANTPSRYSCASCGEKFITRNMLQEHYEASNECQPTKCEVCGRTFVHSSHLKRHLSIHAGIKPFICSICAHEFNQRSDLQRHEKKHTLNGKYTCLKCTQDFDDINVLREHISSHSHKAKVFSCERCDKVFGRKSHYKRHTTIHDGIKPYSCDKCGKQFNQRTDLKRHQLSHLRRELKMLSGSSSVRVKSENNLVCVVCNKVFNTHAAFLEHDLVHQKIMSTGVLY